MENILDYISSNIYLGITFYIGSLMVAIGIWYFKPFKSAIKNKIMHITVSVLAFAFVMYLQLGSSGYAVDFIYGLSNDNKLCLIEEHMDSDGEISYEAHRLYVIDLKTGKREYRMNIDSPEILCVKENSVVLFERSCAVEYDLNEGKKLREWTKEKGFEKFPELASGIQDLNRQSLASTHINSAYLTLTAMNGYKYCYDLMTEELTQIDYLPRHDETGWMFSEYGVYLKEKYNTKLSYNFVAKTGEIDQLKFDNGKDSTAIYDGTFLDPGVVALFENEEFFVVRHYETLANKTAIFTAINFDLSKKWEINQNQLELNKDYGNEAILGVCFANQQQFIATFGGNVVCFNSNDGSILWNVFL